MAMQHTCVQRNVALAWAPRCGGDASGFGGWTCLRGILGRSARLAVRGGRGRGAGRAGCCKVLQRFAKRCFGLFICFAAWQCNPLTKAVPNSWIPGRARAAVFRSIHCMYRVERGSRHFQVNSVERHDFHDSCIHIQPTHHRPRLQKTTVIYTDAKPMG